MKSNVTDFDRNLRSINTKVVSNKARQVNTEFSRLHCNGSKCFLCGNGVFRSYVFIFGLHLLIVMNFFARLYSTTVT